MVRLSRLRFGRHPGQSLSDFFTAASIRLLAWLPMVLSGRPYFFGIEQWPNFLAAFSRQRKKRGIWIKHRKCNKIDICLVAVNCGQTERWSLRIYLEQVKHAQGVVDKLIVVPPMKDRAAWHKFCVGKQDAEENAGAYYDDDDDEDVRENDDNANDDPEMEGDESPWLCDCTARHPRFISPD